jgi:endonuclease/exonuclease/phosphatase family metal-dependent hydrolase
MGLVKRTARIGSLLAAVCAVFAAPAAAQTDIVINAANASVRSGNWALVTDATAANGQALRHPNASAAKLSGPLADPLHYVEVTFEATAGVPYRLWVHGKADSNSWANDSVFVQFSGSVTAAGAAVYRIATTSATEVNIEDCSGCGLSGWKWQDNGWGSATALGPLVQFATTGSQTMRIQTREDGMSIDQIVLSPAAYLSASPSGIITPPPAGGTAPAPVKLKVLDWNTHHGIGTDGVYNIQRFVTWIITSGANVVSLNEVEKFVGSYGNEDQPARYAALLTAQTGTTWYYNFAQRDGNTNGQGNLILSTFPIDGQTDYRLSYSRSVVHVRILVNGVNVNVFSTHTDADSSSRRSIQYDELKAFASQFAEPRVLAGDFNAWPGATEITKLTASYYDAWAVAKSRGIAIAYSGNEAGNTRNSRIDYVWYSKAATSLTLTAMQVFDTRTASGVMPSDHRPIMATFDVR